MIKQMLALVVLSLSLSVHATTVDLTLNFDAYPGDVAWELSDSTGSNIFASGGNYGQPFVNNSLVVPIELTPDDYQFTITDAYGDGICCLEGMGSYSLSAGSLLLYSSDGQYSSGETTQFTVPNFFELEITFDSYPADVSWDISESDTGDIVAFGNGYDISNAGTTLGIPLFLDPNDYIFTISDAYGDGICCSEGAGGYSLFYNTVELYTSNGQFGLGESVGFTIPAPVPVPAAFWLFGSALASLLVVARKGAV